MNFTIVHSPAEDDAPLNRGKRVDYPLPFNFVERLHLETGLKWNASLSQDDWSWIVRKLGISAKLYEGFLKRALATGMTLQAELFASGLIEENQLVSLLAEVCDVEYLTGISAAALLIDSRQCQQALKRPNGLPVIQALDKKGRLVMLIVPEHIELSSFKSYLKANPEVAEMVRFIAPSAMRQPLIARGGPIFLEQAVNSLYSRLPHFSAKIGVTASQGVTAGFLMVCIPVCIFSWPVFTLFILHVFFSICFLSCSVLRLAASVRLMPLKNRLPVLQEPDAEALPIYTVLVALYKEAEIVPELLVSLSKLVWPRSRLEIKLICEADDQPTLDALKVLTLRPYVEVLEVPPMFPRTKPKALSYALPITKGEFVVVYDAEDRPDPFQLIEAWQRFQSSDQNLVCLQAPLVITNGKQNWLTRMFAFEYTALFAGILPWLAHHQMVMPLGGTSNHFRREVLEEIGGWDPYNVTEDADLGVRLSRLGYEIGVLYSPTYEDAPTRFSEWLPQRTRWFKGWMQTWLVHMRQPIYLINSLGIRSFFIAQTMMFCMIVSALCNLVFVATVFAAGTAYIIIGKFPLFFNYLLLLDITVIILGYLAYIAVGWWSLPVAEQRSLWKYIILTPLYWLALSLAAWRATWQLLRYPHHWEKTPHHPRQAYRQMKRKTHIV